MYFRRQLKRNKLFSSETNTKVDKLGNIKLVDRFKSYMLDMHRLPTNMEEKTLHSIGKRVFHIFVYHSDVYLLSFGGNCHRFTHKPWWIVVINYSVVLLFMGVLHYSNPEWSLFSVVNFVIDSFVTFFEILIIIKIRFSLGAPECDADIFVTT